MCCMEIKCNICDETINSGSVEPHVTGRNHSIKKKIAEFHEMNAQMRSPYLNDTSVMKAWIRDLYLYDFLSMGKT